jgi:signal peptide peptidase SppA
MSVSLPHIADRVLGRPLLVTPAKAQTIAAVLGGRIGLEGANISDHDDGPRQSASYGTARSIDGKPYLITDAGTAIIPVVGSLVNRTSGIEAMSGLASYQRLDGQLRAALFDEDVTGVLLDMDTPGGEAGGAFEIPALICELREKKPVIAMVNSMAASAGYAIASAASEIVVTQNGLVGSIGVVLLHVDYSGKLEKDGVAATFIHAGKHKVDGNPLQSLPDTVKADLQAEINRSYELFVETVHQGRPGLSIEQIKSTEARVYSGEQAVEMGLADRVGTLAGILQELETKGISTMAENNDIDTRLAQVEAHVQQAHKLGHTDARKRIQSIMTCEAAQGRKEQAEVIAFESDLSLEVAVMILEAGPKAEASAKSEDPKSAFYQALASNGAEPQVSHDSGEQPVEQVHLHQGDIYAARKSGQ